MRLERKSWKTSHIACSKACGAPKSAHRATWRSYLRAFAQSCSRPSPRQASGLEMLERTIESPWETAITSGKLLFSSHSCGFEAQVGRRRGPQRLLLQVHERLHTATDVGEPAAAALAAVAHKGRGVAAGHALRGPAAAVEQGAEGLALEQHHVARALRRQRAGVAPRDPDRDLAQPIAWAEGGSSSVRLKSAWILEVFMT